MADKPTVTLEFGEFRLPNYLRAPFWGEERTFSVGVLTDEQAAQYWDWMKDKWLSHVRERREAHETTGISGENDG